MKIAQLLSLAGTLLLLGYFQGYLHGVTGAVSGDLKDMIQEANKAGNKMMSAQLRGSMNKFVGNLEINVTERPFGMHIRRGSLVVEEVFPGFPAAKAGVRHGCILQTIAGMPVAQGTWLFQFQHLPIPFNMSLTCPPAATEGQGPMNNDKSNYRVMVVKRPFGMNVQTNTKGLGVPRVVEVLPGSAAEAAGVKKGFVLTAVQDQAVDAETWFHAWQKVTLPCTLTFDTTMPAHSSNPFFDQNGTDATPAPVAPANLPEDWDEDGPVHGFDDVSVSVHELPFGLHIDAPLGKLPIVRSVPAGMPAEAAGVKVGDVLTEVAGHRINSSTWFAAFQHAVPPFGLKFRRPHRTDTSNDAKMPLPVMPHVGDLEVTVSKRPFGMKANKGGHTVEAVFPGFPAQELGVRKGCEIQQIAGQDVSHGTWMELFQKSPLPFTLKLFCPMTMSTKKSSAEAEAKLLKDEHNFQVIVKERPFGMNVHTNVVPRVQEVLPGYPAEAAGIEVGFVLTHINGEHVTVDNWLDIWQHSPVGTTLTFDTNMPLHENSDFVPHHDHSQDAPAVGNHPDETASDVKEGFTDFRCAVKKLPFGMELKNLKAGLGPQGGRPAVKKVVQGSPAEEAGVKVGDVLIEISGLPVDSASWFKAFQQSVPPFGLHFRRPIAQEGEKAAPAVKEGETPIVKEGEMPAVKKRENAPPIVEEGEKASSNNLLQQ